MKKYLRFALVALALVFAVQMACAEPTDALQGIYDALLSEGSAYTQMKATYMEYYPETAFEEALDADGFTLAVSGNEYMEGSWRFDYDAGRLSITLGEEDFMGYTMSLMALNAIGLYYDMNTDLLNSYINGLSVLGMENDDFGVTTNEETGETVINMNAAGPWAMSELDQMRLDADVMDFEPLNDDYRSMAANAGKIMMIANGTNDDVTILLGEYGEWDELAYESLIDVVKVLQPDGWETFTAEYTALEPVEAEGYSVSLDVGIDAAREVIEDAKESYSYALIHFGAEE